MQRYEKITTDNEDFIDFIFFNPLILRFLWFIYYLCKLISDNIL